MQFQVLGSLEVSEDGKRVALGGPKQRLVLAHLLLRANQVVSADALIEEIWGEEPPDAARSALQAYVSRLRKAIGSGRLEGRPPGYVLHADPDEVDALRFERLVRQARERAGRDLKAVASLLDEAFALWRGTPFEELADEPSLRSEVARLEELHLAAAEGRIDAALALGRSPDISELEQLVDRHPLRERLWGHLMVALYRAGRQAEALDAFRRARDLLADELGIDPSPDLQRLHERVLRQDPALEVKGEPLRGYRLLESLGSGAFGVVHRAAQPQLNREVAVKVVHRHLANDLELVRRFEAEAQVVARLEHPRIVPLYDYWRDVDGAYLVTRFLRGGSLRQRLAGGPLEQQETLRVVEQVAEALHAAHRNGVVHGDLKPENVLFDEEGNAYLTDFAIAGDRWAGKRTRPGAAGDLADLARLLSEALGPKVPAAVEALLDRATTEAPDHRFADALELAGAVREALGAPAPGPRPSPSPAADAPNPYKGLRPFQEADEEEFFGRERVVDQLVSRLSEPGNGSRFLAVVGPSGSGKSSVVQAGLVPALRRGAVAGSNRWFVVKTQPGPYPFEELEEALLSVAVSRPANLLEQWGRDEHALSRAARRVLPGQDSELIVVIDQFEEVFTLVRSEPERAQFLAMLAATVADPDSRVRVVVTLRADFYDRPLTHPGFGELVAEHTLAVPPLSAEELERAVSGPAERTGVSLEAPLVAEMVAEVLDQPGALPLLQYALTELFDRREGEVLTLKAYREIGGVSGALARRAEALFDALGLPGREAVRQLFLRLVNVGEEGAEDTRRRVLRVELASLEGDQASMEGVIDAYGAHRLLSFDRDPITRGPTVEVAHEALLREWGRLRGWVEGAREDVRMRRRLDVGAAEWARAGEDPSFLLRGARLDQFEAWAGVTDVALSEQERRFLQRGIERRDAERAEEEARKAHEAALERRSVLRLRALVAVLTVMALVAAALSIVAVGQRGRAQHEARVATARELASAAEANLGVDPQRSILLALQATAATRPDGPVLPDAVQALHDAVAADREVLALRDPSTASVAWSPDGRLIATGGAVGGPAGEDRPREDQVILWDAHTGKKLFTLKGNTAAIDDIAFSPDSSRLASVDGYQTIVWDAHTGRRLLTISARQFQVTGAAFSPDGTMVATAEFLVGTFLSRVRVVDATSGDDLFQFTTEGTVSQAPAFSPDGTRIAVGDDRAIVQWDLRTRQRDLVIQAGELTGPGVLFSGPVAGRKDLVVHTGVSALAYSPDGTRLAATLASADIARVWDAATGGQVETLQGHSGATTGIDWSRDGTRIATGGDDGTARVWDAETGKPLMVLPGHVGLVAMVAFSPDGTRLVAGGNDGTALVWDIAPAATAEALGIAASGGWPTSVAFTPDGSSVVVSGVGAGADARSVGTGGWLGGALWDARTGDRIRDLGDAWFGAAVGAGGSIVATWGKTLAVVDASPGGAVRTLFPKGASLSAIATAPQGTEVAGAREGYGGSSSVLVWDARSGKLIRTFSGWDLSVEGVALSPDGRLVAGLSGLGVLRVLDVQSGNLVFSERVTTGEGRSVMFSPDGSLIATSAGDGVSVWRVPSGKLLDRLGGTGSVGAVAFSPDGSRIATGGDDGAARIWDVATGLQTLTLVGHTGALTGVAFSPDGSRLATTSLDGTLRMYVLQVGELERIAGGRLTRGLTSSECRRYLHVASCPGPAA
jgi:WD40 repeat protein/DNA-binding SARP family transcriptional activator/tRNA A-37 threonylcarbamoyl transferase component Bud32